MAIVGPLLIMLAIGIRQLYAEEQPHDKLHSAFIRHIITVILQSGGEEKADISILYQTEKKSMSDDQWWYDIDYLVNNAHYRFEGRMNKETFITTTKVRCFYLCDPKEVREVPQVQGLREDNFEIK